jgi:NAD(P)-dependent dehydrogenase (short-subunit alcohol dehydrogenase family)
MDTRDLSGRWVGVTGAGSGIGEAIAVAAAQRGADLAICDLDAGRLEAVEGRLRGSGAEVVARLVDVADEESVQAFADAVHARTDALDVLVNNAGVTLAASALETTEADWEWVLGIDLMGVIHGCSSFVPAMRDHGRGGHVVNISSMDGLAAMEGFAAYSTAKFAVVGFSESLRAELRRHRIGVTVVCPGPIRSSLVADMPERGRFAGAYSSRIREENRRKGVPAERVAKAVFTSIRRNRAVCPVTTLAWMTYYMKRLTPSMTARMLDRVEQSFLAD